MQELWDNTVEQLRTLWQQVRWEDFSYLLHPPYVWWLLGILGVLFLWALLRRGQPKDFTAYNNQSGRVRVARKAITDLVRRTCATTPGIARSKPEVRTRGRKLRIRVIVKLRAGYRVDDVSNDLQRNLKRNLREVIGIENLGPIDVIVSGFSGKLPEARKMPPPAALTAPLEPVEEDKPSKKEQKEQEKREASEESYWNDEDKDEDGDKRRKDPTY